MRGREARGRTRAVEREHGGPANFLAVSTSMLHGFLRRRNGVRRAFFAYFLKCGCGCRLWRVERLFNIRHLGEMSTFSAPTVYSLYQLRLTLRGFGD